MVETRYYHEYDKNDENGNDNFERNSNLEILLKENDDIDFHQAKIRKYECVSSG